MRSCRWPLRWLPWLVFLLGGCQTATGELQSLGEQPPLELAVLLTGGCFVTATSATSSTFASPAGDAAAGDAAASDAAASQGAVEVLDLLVVQEVLRQGRVFRRLEGDRDEQRRRALPLALRGSQPALAANQLQAAASEGYDLVLVLEELEDGPIDAQGINGRWPVTLASWLLLGLGALIPDHSFESRSRLRYSLRDPRTGRVLHDSVVGGGPIDLSLLERSDWVGLAISIVVPPFWVRNDQQQVQRSVREVQQRRLLVALARDLKSELVRQRLRERRAAYLALAEIRGRPAVVVEARDGVSVAQLQAAGLLPAAAAAFERELLLSRRATTDGWLYEAQLPELPGGQLVQVAIGTIRGEVVSATFLPRGRP